MLYKIIIIFDLHIKFIIFNIDKYLKTAVTCRSNCTLNVVCQNCTTKQGEYIDAVQQRTTLVDETSKVSTNSPTVSLSSTISQLETTLQEIESSKSTYPKKTFEIPAVLASNDINLDQPIDNKQNLINVDSSTMQLALNDNMETSTTDLIVTEQTTNNISELTTKEEASQ